MSRASVGGALALLMSATSLAAAQSVPIDSVRGLLRSDLTDVALAYGKSAVEARPDDAEAYCALAIAAEDSRDFDLAVESAERCVELAGKVAEHQYVLADAYLSKLNSQGRSLSGLSLATKGKAAAEQAVKLDPDHVRARVMLLEYHMEAPRIAGGSKKEARRQAEEIAKRDPARGVWAELRVMGDDPKDEKLEAVFYKGLPLAGTADDPAGRAMSATTSAANRIDSDALREKLISELYAKLPDDPRAQYQRARLWALQARNLEQAEQIFLDYIELAERPPGGPSTAGAYWRLGLVYEKQGRLDEALGAYRKAVELAPRFRQAQEDVKRLEKM